MSQVNRRAQILGWAILVSAALGWMWGSAPGRPHHVEAASDSAAGTVAVLLGDSDRLYVVDTEAKVIMVYDKSANLIGGRSFKYDTELLRDSALPLRNKGYELRDVKKGLKKLNASGK